MKGTIEDVQVRAYRIPTDDPEADGTYRWDSTTLVVVHCRAGGTAGLGYSYADAAAATLVKDKLAGKVLGRSAFNIPGCWFAMAGSVRNLGEQGIAMLAISAVDTALWDLKAKLVGLPLVDLLGGVRDRVPVYGSGGFTSYTIEQLQHQLAGWVEEGIIRVKMKIGTQPDKDPERIARARAAIGSAQLFVDANGAYDRKQALAMAEIFNDYQVSWFEEPVVHHDLEGLRLIRDRAPATMEISAGEYGFELDYFRRMAEAEAVDVLQADATRCGITGFLQAANLCQAFHLPLSSHCAPALHLHPCCAASAVRHMEYFHDHVRIERMLFDGVVVPVAGELAPDRSRPGLGIELKEDVAKRYEI
ncbi:enolase C-terminal domain-like protein [Geotalea sp. SG265]|uniref:enolase C-terminal domain-like protein n=1 Tax=Geotalea sp. SG265 TaxID=2922867 RepID=UPI001FAEDAE4|nr:enolase C-terminal domain-like protein [Geotalea sp. SG265]